MKAVVCGGFFDPPNTAHIDTLNEAAEKIKPDNIIIVPTADECCADADMRRKMVKLAFPAATVAGDAAGVASELPGGAKVFAVSLDAADEKSDEIRQMLKMRQGREYIAEDVYAFIIRNRLYGAKPDFEWLRSKAYAMLKPKRIPHVCGTEEEAARLAERWGADTDKAREAGILHDITKKEDFNTQLLLCEKYGIIIDDDERKNEKLLHSKTGAAIAKALFGVDDDVYEAIKWHTTGKENMTILEKVIYLADYIEPTRDFEGLEELRRLAYENIDRAVLLGLEMSIGDITARGITPHERTLEAARWLQEHTGDY